MAVACGCAMARVTRPKVLAVGTVALLVVMLPASVDSKGAGGTGGSSGRSKVMRSTYGGGRVSHGYTRTYYLTHMGTRHACYSCSRTSAANDWPESFEVDVVLAEFDVTFQSSGDVLSTATLEPLVERWVASAVARTVPTVTSADVSVTDIWAVPVCTGPNGFAGEACDLDPLTDGTASCPSGCTYDTTTVMFEVAIFGGQTLGAKIMDSLQICRSCNAVLLPPPPPPPPLANSNTSSNASGTNASSPCSAVEEAVLAPTKFTSCCSPALSREVERWLQIDAMQTARIEDCGNATLVRYVRWTIFMGKPWTDIYRQNVCAHSMFVISHTHS